LLACKINSFGEKIKNLMLVFWFFVIRKNELLKRDFDDIKLEFFADQIKK